MAECCSVLQCVGSTVAIHKKSMFCVLTVRRVQKSVCRDVLARVKGVMAKLQ